MVEPMLVGERMRNMIVQVCIGSACHLKGSYDVIKTMQRVIEEDDLKNKVILKSSFCLGKCSDAVSVQVDEGPVDSVIPADAEAYLKRHLEVE